MEQKRRQGQGKEGRGVWTSHLPPGISSCSPTRKLFEPCHFRVFMSFYYVGMTDHWRSNSISSPSALPGGRPPGGGMESSNPPGTMQSFWPPGLTRSCLHALPQQSFHEQTLLIPAQIPRVLGAACRELGTKTKCTYLTVSQSGT